MRILCLLPRYYEEKNSSTLEKELVLELAKENEVTVATLSETGKTYLKKVENVEVFKINVGDYYSTKVTKIDKGLTMLKLPYIFNYNIKKYLGNKKYDLVITSTPMLNNPYLMKKLKVMFNSEIMLIIWDIFPQNAVDLKILKNKILIKLFSKKYDKAIQVADYISCMSNGNREYLIEKYKENKEKFFILKNWAQIKEIPVFNKKEIREKYGYTEDDLICIFGGNMGKPQKLENILELAKKSLENSNVKFLFVGKGTERVSLENKVKIENIMNVKFLDYIPREDYELVTASADLGIVSLDERFTVPNFPSKTTDYFKLKLPILASLDSCASKDYGNFLQNEVKGGLFAEAGNSEELYKQLLKLANDKRLREQLGNNGRKYYENELGVDKAYETIMKTINKIKN
ncbi:glycosyltransferase family 4 protein [Cetobacterium sp.]|uniref:glycosyltransferase family 4 protein n=1 Tax=Cetobacterium sp. TaxID=2071632 RepID=UPI003F3E340B